MQKILGVAVRVVVAWLAAGTVQAANSWWVDSLGAGDGTSSGTPMSSLTNAINQATAGDTIFISGATGRSYAYSNQACRIAKAGLTLTNWGGNPVFLSGSTQTNNATFLTVDAAGVALYGLTFQIDKNWPGAGTDVILLTTNASNGRVDGCTLGMTNGPGGAWNFGYLLDVGSSGNGLQNQPTNILIRNCLFQQWQYDPLNAAGPTRETDVRLTGSSNAVINCTFSNCTHAITFALSQYLTIRSNQFLNLVGMENTGTAAAGIIRGAYGSLYGSEISYNIAWNSIGSNGARQAFIFKYRDTARGGTRIFNNTTYNLQRFIDWQNPQTGEAWTPRVDNNLMVSSLVTNFSGQTTNTVDLVGSNVWAAGAYLGYNVWTGPNATLVDTNAQMNGTTLTNNYNLTVSLANTNNPAAANFRQPDSNLTPLILQGYGTVSNAYPVYIGAVIPRALYPRGTVQLFR